MKYCYKCKEIKPISEFHKDLTKKDKVQGACKFCKIKIMLKWQKENPEKACLHALDWQRKYPHKANLKALKRQLAKAQRIPKWADLKAIEAFYANCPKGYQVDHIIPLRGKRVSGLHVLSNLQYLLAKDNAQKGNRF